MDTRLINKHDQTSFNVCWDITSNCNEHCLFCYRNSDDKDLPLETNYLIFIHLVDAGAEKISFTGGEPLLYKGLFELARMGKEYNNRIKLSLTTNGLLLAKWDEKIQSFLPNVAAIEKIAAYFDWIAMSLDAPEAEKQSEVTRNAQHYDRVMFLIDYIKSNHPNLKIKINTLVSKVNYLVMPALFELLKKKGIQRWKLFDFMPSRGYAQKNKDLFYISEELFNQVCMSLNIDSKDSIKVTFNSYQDFKDAYFYVSSDGFLVSFDGESYKKVADCRKELKDFLYREYKDIFRKKNNIAI